MRQNYTIISSSIRCAGNNFNDANLFSNEVLKKSRPQNTLLKLITVFVLLNNSFFTHLLSDFLSTCSQSINRERTQKRHRREQVLITESSNVLFSAAMFSLLNASPDKSVQKIKGKCSDTLMIRS